MWKVKGEGIQQKGLYVDSEIWLLEFEHYII
jgi:hypothetical protein